MAMSKACSSEIHADVVNPNMNAVFLVEASRGAMAMSKACSSEIHADVVNPNRNAV